MRKPWFARRRYGYGKGPVSWEGWLATALWAAGLFAILRYAAPALAPLIGWQLSTTILAATTAWILAYGVLIQLTSAPRGA